LGDGSKFLTDDQWVLIRTH